MALPPSGTTDEAFIREVDEEYRRDRMTEFARRWGRWIIGAVVVALLVFAGVLWFNHRNARAAEQQGERYDAALEALGKSQPAQAEPELTKLAAEGKPGIKALSGLLLADIAAQKDKKAGAAKLGQIAADTSLPQPFRDEALIRQTALEFDTLKPEVVIDRLKGLAVADSPWFPSAAEMVAAAYLKQGKRDAAGKLFGELAQSRAEVPDTIRQRAVQMASVLGVDAIGKSEEKKSQ